MTTRAELVEGTAGFTAVVPADSSYIRLARMLVASFAADAIGLDEDRLDALRIGVSEAFTAALEQHHAAGSGDALCLETVQAGPAAVEITVHHAGEPAPDAPHLVLARALVEDARSWHDGDGAAVTIKATSIGLGR